jgi:hypothetical protein
VVRWIAVLAGITMVQQIHARRHTSSDFWARRMFDLFAFAPLCRRHIVTLASTYLNPDS